MKNLNTPKDLIKSFFSGEVVNAVTFIPILKANYTPKCLGKNFIKKRLKLLTLKI